MNIGIWVECNYTNTTGHYGAFIISVHGAIDLRDRWPVIVYLRDPGSVISGSIQLSFHHIIYHVSTSNMQFGGGT